VNPLNTTEFDPLKKEIVPGEQFNFKCTKHTFKYSNKQ